MLNKEQRKKLFLFTVDADWIPGSEPGFEQLMVVANRYRLKMTAFAAGRFAKDNPLLLQAALAEGHEIGTHGWEHGLDWRENYSSASYQEQKETLLRATETIAEVTGARPTCFRAPFLSVSETLFSVLHELDYRIDSSVPARRYDGTWGAVSRWRYYFAPLDPYCPDPLHLGQIGRNSIVEVPLSAFFFPLVMGTIRRAGLRPTLWVAKQVYKRASVLNFYCHPWEFVEPDRRPFPAEASKRYSKGTGPEWLKVLSEFIEEILSWGCVPATVSEAANYADCGGDDAS